MTDLTQPPCIALDLVRLREAATVAQEPWHPYGDERLPALSTQEDWARDVDNYLGGAWGEFCREANPWAIQALLDRLERAEAACASGGEVVKRNPWQRAATRVRRAFSRRPAR